LHFLCSHFHFHLSLKADVNAVNLADESGNLLHYCTLEVMADSVRSGVGQAGAAMLLQEKSQQVF
jgi:hypothetical protein